jgi:hypothetical protein
VMGHAQCELGGQAPNQVSNSNRAGPATTSGQAPNQVSNSNRAGPATTSGQVHLKARGGGVPSKV